MSSYSRRQVIRDLGIASAAGILSATAPGYGQKIKSTGTTISPSDLYLIFPGAWLCCFENGGINVVTTDFTEHTYDLGISLPSGQPRMPIEKGATYSVSVAGYTPAANSQAIVASMKSGSQGLIFANAQRKSSIPAGLRAISLPIPSAIHPAALLSGITIGIDPSITQIPNIQHWPAALAFIYSGWTSASVTSSDTTQPVVTLNSGPITHLSFRTCLTAKCNMPLNCAIDCTEIAADVAHAQIVFKSMMDLLDLGVKPEPTLKFPDCTSGPTGAGGTWGVSIDPGSDPNIDRSEIGMPVECGHFANLHNCAAGVGIVGA